MGNTYFERRSFHKYTRMARGQGGVEVKGMIGLVLVKKDMLRKIRLGGSWTKTRRIICIKLR